MEKKKKTKYRRTNYQKQREGKIIKIRVEINETENIKQKVGCFEKFNKVDTFLTRLPKKKGERKYKLQISGINEETSLQTLEILKGQRNTISNLGP